jgi:NlpC/P60 family putative phage cell wall peptidase
MITREEIVDEANSWLGTKYHNAARIKGVGVDCAQLIYMVYHQFGLIPELPAEARSPRWFIANRDSSYLDSVLKYAAEIKEEQIQPGDLVLYRTPSFPVFHHGGIVISWPHIMVHAVQTIGVCYGHATNEGFITNAERKVFTFMQHT